MKFLLNLTLFFLLMAPISAQVGFNYGELMPMFDMQDGDNHSKSKMIQTTFIQTLFVDKLFEIDLPLNDEEEDSIMSNETNEFFNSILSYEISKELAEQDILGLNDLTLDF